VFSAPESSIGESDYRDIGNRAPGAWVNDGNTNQTRSPRGRPTSEARRPKRFFAMAK
jgi:hypothetical protein